MKDAVGPWVIMPYHGGFSFAPEIVDMLPNGTAWRESIEAARPEGERHLAVHEGHVTHVTERDRELVLESSWHLPMRAGFWIGTRDELRAKAEHAGANGSPSCSTRRAVPTSSARCAEWPKRSADPPFLRHCLVVSAGNSTQDGLKQVPRG